MSSSGIEFKGSLHPKKWGPPLWSVLHSLPESVQSVEKIKGCLGNLCLPCAECQEHYEEFLAARPTKNIQTRTQAFDWIFDLHNDVNARTGKPPVTREAYDQSRRAGATGRAIITGTFAPST